MKRLRYDPSMSSSNSNLPDRKSRLASYLRYKEMIGRREHPASQYGHPYIRRGQPETLAFYGETYKKATPAQKANRANTGWTGRGIYKPPGGWGHALMSTLRTGSKALRLIGSSGRHLAADAAAARGSLSGRGLYMGRGAYSSLSGGVGHANNLIAGGGGSVPHMVGVGDETGAVCITHREYISDVYAPGVQNGSAVSFQNTAYNLNPGLAATFPFLSQIAQNYDEYEFVKLVFTYRSTTTDIGNSTTGQCGTVILCTNYNSASAPFTDKQSMLEYAHAHDCKLTEHMDHGVECDPAKTAMSTQLFVRSNPVVSNQDLKTYDKGIFQIAIANCPSAYNGFPVGELWVEYSCMLRKPKLFVTRGLEIDRDAFYTSTNIDSGAKLLIPSGANPPLFNLGASSGSWSGLTAQQNNIGSAISLLNQGLASGGVSTASFTITFPAPYTGPCKVIVEICVVGTGAQPWTGLTVTNGTNSNIIGINDLYDSLGIPSNFDRKIYIANTTDYIIRYEGHYFISMATQGYNNSINFLPVFAAAGLTAQTMNIKYATINIEQYQTLQNSNQSAATPSFRPSYVNSVGVLATPI